MFVIINPNAHGGRASAIWDRIRPDVVERFGPFEETKTADRAGLAALVRQGLASGEVDFVAAGGDGTVNALLNALLEVGSPAQVRRIRLGAIGLGSSNDFHKPLDPSLLIGGVSCRIDFDRAARRDVGRISYVDGCVTRQVRHWLLNASIGITADANAAFNEPDPLLFRLKRRWVNASILYAALKTITLHRNRRVRLQMGEAGRWEGAIANIAVLKSPHCSGVFRYDVPYGFRSGRFYVHVCHDLGRFGTLEALWRLGRHKIAGMRRTQLWSPRCLVIEADEPFAVEFDGEVVRTARAAFDVRHDLVEVCP